jgi:hypothetical protein
VAEARWLEDLSPAQSAAMVRYSNLVVTVAQGPTAFGIGQATHDSLVRGGLVGEAVTSKRRTKVWRPTERGKLVLLTAAPQLLAARSDELYTTETGRALFPDAGEAIGDMGGRLASESERHGLDTELLAEHREVEDEIRLLRQLAAERGLDIRNDMRVIKGRLDAIKRRILDQRAEHRQAEVNALRDAA